MLFRSHKDFFILKYCIPSICFVIIKINLGATVACQRVMELRRVCRREWSRIVAIIVACQGVMELRRIRRREWSSAVRYCGLPGGPDLSAEVRLESVAGVGSEVRHL